jgi:hypothetical protein
MFYAKTPVSSGLKQRFTNDIAEITVLSVLNAANTKTASESRLKEILVIAVLLNTATVPIDALEHIAKLRPSGILFVCIRVRDGIAQGALAVRRARPGRAGHIQQSTLFVGDWQPAADITLTLDGSNADELWESLNAQTILNSSNPQHLDERIARRDGIAELSALESKLAKDHARAKNPTQRNEIYAKLHKTRTELSKLQQESQQDMQ